MSLWAFFFCFFVSSVGVFLSSRYRLDSSGCTRRRSCSFSSQWTDHMHWLAAFWVIFCVMNSVILVFLFFSVHLFWFCVYPDSFWVFVRFLRFLLLYFWMFIFMKNNTTFSIVSEWYFSLYFESFPFSFFRNIFKNIVSNEYSRYLCKIIDLS